MSQLFGTKEDNKIEIRVNDITANNVYQFNIATGQYERVAGGGHTQIPYYLKTNSIDIDSGSSGSELSANALTLGDSSGNETLNKDKIKILSQLKDNIVDVNISNYQDPFPVAFDKTTSNFERLSRLNIGTYSQYCSVAQTQISAVDSTNIVQITPTGINIKSPIGEYFLTSAAFKGLKQIIDNVATPSIGSTYTGKFLVSYDKSNNSFERSSNFSLGTSTVYSYFDNLSIRVANGSFYTSVTSQGLTVKDNSSTVNLTYDDVKTVNKLVNPTLVVPSANSKIVIFNTVTKEYNTSDLQNTTLPSYLLPNSIEMSSTQFVKCGLSGNNITIKSDSIVVNTFTKPEIILDYNTLKNIPKRTSYFLNTTADWTYAPYSDVSGGSITTSIKIPNFDLNCIGDNVYIRMSAYNSINLDTAGSGGLKAFIFTCPYLEKASYNSRVKFEIKHLNPDSGDEATIQYMLPVVVTNSGRTKKCFAFSAALNTFLGGTIRIKLLEYPFAITDDVLTASSFPSTTV